MEDLALFYAGLILLQFVLIALAFFFGKKDEGVAICSLILFMGICFMELILPVLDLDF